MTDEASADPASKKPKHDAAPPSGKTLAPADLKTILELPGLAAIAFYLLVLAAVIVLGVVGGHYPPLFLALAAAFITASGGLLRLFRWAWALALAAVLLLAIYNLWIFSAQHAGAAVVQGLLNFVFFLYLVRDEVRRRLR
jgi:hypothetical protein